MVPEYHGFAKVGAGKTISTGGRFFGYELDTNTGLVDDLLMADPEKPISVRYGSYHLRAIALLRFWLQSLMPPAPKSWRTRVILQKNYIETFA